MTVMGDDTANSPQRRRRGRIRDSSYKTHFKTQQDQALIRLALHKSPFFSCLDEEQVRVFVETAQLQTFRAGEIVILEGCVDDDDDDDDDDQDEQEKETLQPATAYSQQDLDQPALAEADDYMDADEDEDYKVHEQDSDRTVEVIEDDSNDGESSTTSGRTSTPQKNSFVIDDGSSHQNKVETMDGTDEANDSFSVADEGSIQIKPSTIQAATADDAVPSLHNENDSVTSSSSSSFEKREATNSESDQSYVAAVGDTLSSVEDSDSESTGPQRSASTSSSLSSVHPPPPRSGIPRSIYIIRKGNAGVWYQPHFNPASLGPGSLFGEGGFLFGRQHSASIVAAAPAAASPSATADSDNVVVDDDDVLECWVVDIATFRHHVLPSNNMRQIFHKYAVHKDDDAATNAYYMTMDDFVKAVTEQQTEANNLPTMQDYSLVSLRMANTYSILRHGKQQRTSSTQKNGEPKIYLEDFCFFYLLMARPDPEVDIAFLLMDEKQTGQIFLADLAKFLRPVFPDLDLESQFFQRYFGKDGTHSIRQINFSQFLVDLQRELGKQAFLRAVETQGTRQGYLAPAEFAKILKTACGWRLPEGVAKRLEEIYGGHHQGGSSLDSNSDRQTVTKVPPAFLTENSHPYYREQRDSSLSDHYFAYGDFLAFQEVLGNLPFICNLIDQAQEIKKGPLSPDDFKVANRVLGLGGRLSRRQVDIVFGLFDLDCDGYVSHEDTVKVCGADYARRLVPVKGRGERLTFAPPPQYSQEEGLSGTDNKPTLVEQIAARALNFSMAAIAGGFGIGLLYPVDLAKTRLMNQRIGVSGSKMYQSSLDCIQQAVRFEGFAGVYRGLLPPLLGVAPERIIKLQVQSLLLQAFNSIDEDISGGKDKKPNLLFEAMAGGCAGACQLLVTNPIEITKIRLQMQGETARLLTAKGITPPTPTTFQGVIKDLGFPGVYRGASACLLRDVPFSAIYFPAYTACKELLIESNSSTRKARPSDLLLAGTIAGIPAALLTAPADVLKTRLQVIARPGETSYAGIRDCATKIYEQEGIAAFFQGSFTRVLRIAPQFGISLLAYEGLSQLFGFERASRPPTNAPIDPLDYRSAFPDKLSGTSDFFGNRLQPDSHQQHE